MIFRMAFSTLFAACTCGLLFDAHGWQWLAYIGGGIVGSCLGELFGMWFFKKGATP